MENNNILTGSLAKNDIFSGALVNKVSEINLLIFDNSTWTVWKIFENWENILIAIWVLLIWWLFSSLIEKVILFIFKKIKLKIFLDKLKFRDFLEKAQIKSSPLEIATKFLKWYIFLSFFLISAKIVWLKSISDFLDSVVAFLPNLIVALFIVLLWFQFSETTSAFIKNALKVADSKWAIILSVVTKYIIITFSILAALAQIKIAEDFLNILFIWVVSTISLWIWLSFWLWWARFVEKRLDKFEEKKDVKK